MTGLRLLKGLLLVAVVMVPLLSYAREDEQNETDGPGYAEWSMDLRGSYRNLFTYQRTDAFVKDRASAPGDKVMAADLNRISFSPEITHGENFTFQSDMDIEAIFSNYNRTIPFDLYWREQDYNDFTKPSVEPVYNRYMYLDIGIRNLYVKMARGSFTVTLGRQQIRFGSSRLWNPLDLLNPFSPVHVEGNDEQNGIDALRLDWYPGESTEFTLVANPVRQDDRFAGTRPGSSNYAARFKTGMSDFDLALLAAYTAKRKNAGIDFQYVLFDGMLTGAALWSGPAEGKSYVQCAAGYEYTFGSGIYLLAEYFYNSLPVNDDSVLAEAVMRMTTEGMDSGNYYVLANRIITYNRHYASIAAGYDIHPLLRGEIFTICDFQGRGLFFNILLRLNAMQNCDLSAGAISSFVDENKLPCDFDPYDKKPLYYASADYYF